MLAGNLDKEVQEINFVFLQITLSMDMQTYIQIKYMEFNFPI